MRNLDERLTLHPAQGVMLCCLRAWVAGRQGEGGPVPPVATMLARVGATPAAPHVDSLMQALTHGAMRPIGIACTAAPQLTPDEQLLLDVLALAQHGRTLEATMALRGLVTADAAHAACRSAGRLGAALATAGRVLPAPDAPVAHYAIACEPLEAMPPRRRVLH